MSSPLICSTCPSRKTLATGEAIFFNASIASSAFDSWKTPRTALSNTTAKMIIASVGSGSPWWANIETTAATKSTKIMKSLNWSTNFSNSVFFLPSCNVFAPYFSSLDAASWELKPEGLDCTSLNTSSTVCKYTCFVCCSNKIHSFSFSIKRETYAHHPIDNKHKSHCSR